MVRDTRRCECDETLSEFSQRGEMLQVTSEVSIDVKSSSVIICSSVVMCEMIIDKLSKRGHSSPQVLLL